VSLVNEASSFALGFAQILAITADGTLEKTGTAITSKDAVVFAGRMILADSARDVVQDATY